MASIDLRTDGTGAFARVPKDKLTDVNMVGPIRIAGARQMVTGIPIVAIGLFLPNQKGCVFSQTSLECFLDAADNLKKEYGDPRIRGNIR